MTYRKRIIIAGFLTITALLNLSQAATLTSTVDRNQIGLNETMQLRISYDQQVDSSLLNFNALSYDFEVLDVRPQSSSSISVVNGKTSRVAATVWSIVLAPKRIGKLTIPRFSLNGDNSNAIAIAVHASAGAASGSADQPMIVTLKTDRKAIYPQQQLIVEVTISVQNNVADLNGSPLTIENAEVVPLGQQTFQRIDNGIARQFVVLKYAVFAEQAGQLKIPALRYTGIKGGSRSIFGSRGQQVLGRSKAISIKVNNVPSAEDTDFSSASWFPAENVVLSAEWSGDTASLKVGEPITRTISITAIGQRAGLIPPLEKPISDTQYKLYQDQPQLDTQPGENGITSSRVESEALVPSFQGEITLPEIKVQWWDIREQRWRVVVLPAEKMNVAGVVDQDAATANDLSINNALTQNQQGLARQNEFFIWQIIGAVFALICLFQAWFIMKLRRKPISLDDAKAFDLAEKPAWQQLQKSLSSNDTKLVRKNLLAWSQAALQSKERVTLQSLVNTIDDPILQEPLQEFDSYLYSSSRSFDIDKFKNSLLEIRELLLAPKTNQAEQQLDPLYKTGSPDNEIR